MPLVRRLPKRGFRPLNHVQYAIVNLRDLARFATGSAVGPDEMKKSGLIRGRGPIKCLGAGALAHALTVRANAFSAKAREQIEAAGGSVEVVGA